MDNEQAIQKAIQPFSDLIETLEILRDAVVAQDKDQSFEAATLLLTQYMDTFGHDAKLLVQTFPSLETLKSHIQSKNFDEAYPLVLAFLAKFRRVREGLRQRVQQAEKNARHGKGKGDGQNQP